MKYTNLVISELETGQHEDLLADLAEEEGVVGHLVRAALTRARREWETENMGPDEYRKEGMI